MLYGITKEEGERLAKECKKKFEDKATEIMQMCADYEIRTYEEAYCELGALDAQYQDELHDYTDFWCDSVTDHLISMLKNCSEHDSLQVSARQYLEVLGVTDRALAPHWENDKGEFCDEYGRPLSQIDPDHSVFEVVKGGKQDKK